MNVLFVGTGSGGSWEIRGKQIGRALGARVSSKPTENDWAWADLVVLVKHAAEQFGEEAARSRARIIWDVLDWWKQPEENALPISDTAFIIETWAHTINADALIGSTAQMAQDIGGVYIPHHHRIGLSPAPVRWVARVVAYEGTKKYLGSWAKALQKDCTALGLEFVINPKDLGVADIVVAFRGEKWDGPICRQWKSGVKIVNAIAAGRPIITQPSSAGVEIAPVGTVIDDPLYLDGSLEQWLNPEIRQATAETCAKMAPAYSLEAVCQQYRQLFNRVMRRAA